MGKRGPKPKNRSKGNGNIFNSYHRDNLHIVELTLRKYTEKEFKPILLKFLCEIARMIVDAVDGNFSPWLAESIDNNDKLPYGGNDKFPVWYGQMHDATYVAVYNDGWVYQFLPTKKALDTQSQMYEGVKGYIGNECLKEAIELGLKDYPEGVWIVLFCAVPYAYQINDIGSSWGRGQGFFEEFKRQLIADVVTGLESLKPY